MRVKRGAFAVLVSLVSLLLQPHKITTEVQRTLRYTEFIVEIDK